MFTESSNLATHHCVPCEGGTQPLTRAEFAVYLDQVPDWEIIDDKALQKTFTLKNFVSGVEVINKIAQLAESEGHHPDLNLFDYKKLTVHLTTHAINGLSINDFVMAVKIDGILSQVA